MLEANTLSYLSGLSEAKKKSFFRLKLGINIFSLLNLPTPPNVTDLEGWRVIFSSNSSNYNNISSILEVRGY